jgi:hypothetical protein
MVGVWRNAHEELIIWGIVQTGPRWLQSAAGGRHHAPKPPPALIVKVRGPGHLEVSHGSVPIAKLEGGQVTDVALNVFESKWLPASFAAIRNEVMESHLAARAGAKTPWATIDDEVIRLVAQNMVKRLIATVRNTHHGGTIIIVPRTTCRASGGRSIWKPNTARSKQRKASGRATVRPIGSVRRFRRRWPLSYRKMATCASLYARTARSTTGIR